MAEHLTVTPSGLEILFEDGERDPDSGKAKRRGYLVDGVKLPSVTTVLSMLDKPALMWWSEKLAVDGCIQLAQGGGLPVSLDVAMAALTSAGLRHFQERERKAERGTLTHDELLAFAEGKPPRPLSDVPADERGFVRGVAAFLADLRPRITQAEQYVASPSYGYAGRPDFCAELGVTRLPDGSPAPRGAGLIDLKSHDRLPRTKPSKAHPAGQLKTPYPEHLLQVGLYEVARRESGYEPTAWQAVVRVDADGAYDLTCSWLDPDESVCLLDTYRLFKRATSRVKSSADQLPVGLGLEAVA